MPGFPDIESALDDKGLLLYTLTVLPPVGATSPTLDQVAGFLADRSVIGQVQDGTLTGTPGTFDIFLALFEDETVAITSPTGSVGHGQPIFEFCGGAAYALQADVVLEGELRFDVRGQSGPYDHDEEMELRAYHNRTLTICAYPTPMPAYAALLGTDGIGQYGLSGDHVVISPDYRYLLFPTMLEDTAGALPLVTFQRTGQVRSVQLALEATEEYSITVGSFPDSVTLPCGPEGTESQAVSQILAQNVALAINDDLPKRTSKIKKTPLAGYDLFDRLERRGVELSQVPPEQFFTEAGKLLGYGPELMAVIETLETRPIKTDPDAPLPTHLGPMKVTTVDAASVPTKSRVATWMYLEKLLGKPSGDGKVKSTWLQFRNTAVYQAIVLGLAAVVGIAAVALLLVPSLYEWADLGVSKWTLVFLGLVYVVAAGSQGFVWFLGRRRARELLARAQADGVYEFGQRAPGVKANTPPAGFIEYR